MPKHPNGPYFYLNGKLYRRIRVERTRDFVYCFDYERFDEKLIDEEDCFVRLPWIETRKRMERAYKTNEVEKFLNREKHTLTAYVKKGYVSPKRGGKVWKRASDMRKNTFRPFLWSKDHILELHDVLVDVHAGRPRVHNPQFVTPKPMTPRVMLEAQLGGSDEYYVRTVEGDFIPVWSEPDW